MIEIYDEMSHIKDVLAHGFGNDTWKTDGKLLAMYYRDTGIKKSEALRLIKQKCERYCDVINGGNYNKTSSYKIVNTFVNKVYKKEKDGTYKENIRQITEVVITKDILNWFLKLEKEFIISKEEVEKLKKRRPGLTIKPNVMNFNRIKYLFTLYIWTLIKEQYLDKPDIIYLNDNKNRKKFKESADLLTGFNIIKERNLLFDLGFIDVNHGLGIIPKFKTDVNLFQELEDKKKKEKSEENFEKTLDKDKSCDIITIKGNDLYKCGYWLLKQRNGSFICQNCGDEFANYSLKRKGGKPRKYCKECAEKVNAKLAKKRFCVDCGKEILYTKYSDKIGVKRRSLRCEECRVKHQRELELRYQKKIKLQ